MTIDTSLGIYVQNQGNGTGADRYAPYYIVGNTLQGDTLNNCNYLDTAGIQAALDQCLVDFNTRGITPDIWIRPGFYLPNPALPDERLKVKAPFQRMRGAGMNDVFLISPEGQSVLEIQNTGFEITDLSMIESVGTPSGAASLPGLITYTGGLTVGERFPCSLRRIYAVCHTPNVLSPYLLRGCFFFDGPPLNYGDQFIVDECIALLDAAADPINNADPLLNTFAFVRTADSSQPTGITFKTCIAAGFETGFGSGAQAFRMTDCIYYSPSTVIPPLNPATNAVGFYSQGKSTFLSAIDCYALIRDQGSAYLYDGAAGLGTPGFSGVAPNFRNSYANGNLTPNTIGFEIRGTGNPANPAVGCTIHNCRAMRCDVGYQLTDALVQYTAGVADISYQCPTPLIDNGSNNDLSSHLVVIP